MSWRGPGALSRPFPPSWSLWSGALWGLGPEDSRVSRGQQGLHPEAGAGAGAPQGASMSVAYQALVGDTVQKNSPRSCSSPGPELTERGSDGMGPRAWPGCRRAVRCVLGQRGGRAGPSGGLLPVPGHCLPAVGLPPRSGPASLLCFPAFPRSPGAVGTAWPDLAPRWPPRGPCTGGANRLPGPAQTLPEKHARGGPGRQGGKPRQGAPPPCRPGRQGRERGWRLRPVGDPAQCQGHPA